MATFYYSVTAIENENGRQREFSCISSMPYPSKSLITNIQELVADKFEMYVEPSEIIFNSRLEILNADIQFFKDNYEVV